MRYIITAILLMTTLCNATEVQQLTIKRVAPDTYATSNYQYAYNQKKLIIQTEYCYESAYSDTPATLIYDQYNRYNSKLIFGAGKECRVKAVYVEAK